MDREEWMYKLSRVGNDLSFLHHVRNFVAAAKKHESWSTPFVRAIAARTNFSRNIMWFQSHLIWQDFVKDYTIWKFHGEADPSVTGASERNSSTTSTVNERPQQPSSSIATVGGNSANRDYINIDDLLQDIGGSDDGGDGEQGDLLGSEDAEIF